MLKNKWFWFGITITCILVYAGFLLNAYEKTKEELNYSNQNLLAFSNENSELKDKTIEFQLTIEQLNYFNDSLLQRMNEVRNELGIKDKQIKSLQYQLTHAHKVDSIFFHDTIFRDPQLDIDTTLKDDWYSLNLNLKYPSTIVVSPCFKSEKFVIASVQKEIIGTPKKCFIARWFQKKQQVVIVDVIENSPYIETDKSRFIEIVR